ncbi:unnamed protein product, partial [Prorocentrum cordatum]
MDVFRHHCFSQAQQFNCEAIVSFELLLRHCLARFQRHCANLVLSTIIQNTFQRFVDQVSTLGFVKLVHLGGTWTITVAWRDPEVIGAGQLDVISPAAGINAPCRGRLVGAPCAGRFCRGVAWWATLGASRALRA